MGKNSHEQIRNRIVGHGDEPLDQIIFNPNNWRIHPKAQQEALSGVLTDIGWVGEVMKNVRTGNLVDGHLRCLEADKKGEKTVPTTYVDLSEDEERLILATFDPIGAMAAADKQKLDELLREIDTGNAEVMKMLAEIAEKEGLISKTGERKEPTPIVSYLIIFDDDDQQNVWFKFIRYLKAKVEDGDTISAKLAAFIEQGGYDKV